jgi:hypothetical protein
MENSMFYSDAMLNRTLSNQQYSNVSTQDSGGGFVNKAGNVLKQIVTGIDAANQAQGQQYAMNNPLYNFNNQYPQQNQAAMAYGYNGYGQQRDNTLVWVLGGAVVIGGIAYLAKENLDD